MILKDFYLVRREDSFFLGGLFFKDKKWCYFCFR